MNSIYVARDGEKFGPYDETAARAFFSEGRIAPHDLIWCEGMSQWQPAKDVLTMAADAVLPPPNVSPAAVEPSSIEMVEQSNSVKEDPVPVSHGATTTALQPETQPAWKTVLYGIFGLIMLISVGMKACSLPGKLGSSSAPSVPSKFKSLRDDAAGAVKDYMLASTGKGLCDTVTNSIMSDVRVGMAAYQYGKPERSITGSYTADCTYYIIGEKKVKRETYWFHITQEESSGRMNGTILLDNPEMIARSLAQSNFKAEN